MLRRIGLIGSILWEIIYYGQVFGSEVKRVAVWVGVVAAAVVAVIGICFGKVIEGSVFAEVMKWVLMGAIVVGILEGFVYFLGPLVWHFTYGKRR